MFPVDIRAKRYRSMDLGLSHFHSLVDNIWSWLSCYGMIDKILDTLNDIVFCNNHYGR